MDQVKFHSNERAGLPDFKAATGPLILEDLLRLARSLILPDGRNTGAALTGARVLSGFGLPSDPTGTSSFTVTRGAALVPFWNEEDNTVTFGLLLADEGDPTKILDFSAAGAGSWAVYARFIYAASDFQNRVFWDADGAPAAEYVDNVATRRSAQWELVYQAAAAAPPGNGEWIKIWTVSTDAGNLITAYSDFRHLFFEGSAASADGPFGVEWGDGALDRDSDRASNGIGDFHQWVQAIRRQLTDMLLNTGAWYDAVTIALGHLIAEHHGYASGSSDRGKHKLVTLGDTNRWWTLTTTGTDPAVLATFKLTGVGGGAPVLTVYNAPGSGVSAVTFEPRGAATAMTDGDIHQEVVGGAADDFNLIRERIAVDHHEYQFRGANYTEAIIAIGSGANPGVANQYKVGEGLILAVGAEGGYQVTERTVAMMVPLTTMRNVSSGWYLMEGSGVGNAAVYGFRFESGNADDVLCLMVEDFPEGARLEYVDVLWQQDAVSGVSRDMRMYVGRQTINIPNVGDVSATGVVPISLSSVADFITVGGFTGYRCDRFTPNRNNTDFTRAADRLAIGIYSSDDSSKTHQVIGVRCVWRFAKAHGYPLASTHTA